MPFVMKAHGKLLSVRGSCEADDDGIAHSTDVLESCGYCTSCDTGTVTTGCVTTCGLYLIRTMDLYVTLTATNGPPPPRSEIGKSVMQISFPMSPFISKHRKGCPVVHSFVKTLFWLVTLTAVRKSLTAAFSVADSS